MNERHLVLSFDFDDVIVPTAYKVLDHYRNIYGHTVDPARFYEGTAEDWGVTEFGDINLRIEKYFHSKNFLLDSRTPDPAALIAIPALARKHELHIVTGRGKFMEKATSSLIDEHFPDCFQSVTHTNFFKRRFRRTKGQVCQELGADIHIDDHLVHCESVLDSGIEHAFAYGDYEWNRMEIIRNGLRRCLDWDSILKGVDEVAAA